MAPKHLKFESASDSEEETPMMEVKKQKDPSASSVVAESSEEEEESSEEEESCDDEGEKPLEKKETASQVVDAASQAVKTAESSEEEEESSDDEGVKPLEKKETASQVVVAAAPTAKRKAVLLAEEQEDGDVEEKTRKKKATSSEVVVDAQARSDMAKKKKKKVTFPKEVVKHERKKAKISDEENVAVVVETVDVKKEEIGGASSEKNLFKPLLKEKDQLRFLQVILDLKNDKGKKPQDDKNGFYKSIKDVVEAKNITLNQCMRQIETFREKYKKKLSQGKVPSSSSNSHDKRFFELGKEIWGSTFPAVEKTRTSDRVKIKEERDMINVEQDGGGDWFGKSKDLVHLVTAFGIEEDWMKRMWTSVPTKNKKKMEQKWKVLKKQEFEMVTNKTSFVHEMVSMMSEASSQ